MNSSKHWAEMMALKLSTTPAEPEPDLAVGDRVEEVYALTRGTIVGFDSADGVSVRWDEPMPEDDQVGGSWTRSELRKL